jgi:cyclophilin family peptidyl-prolyl cis-trans isomerase
MNNYNKGISSLWIIIIIVAIVVLGGLAYYLMHRPAAPMPTTPAENTNNVSTNTSTVKNMSHFVTITTSMGDITFTTYDADAPKTVENFITLANKGFYDGLIFHRVIPQFMIQGGDPTGTGMGGPGYKFADELNPETDSYKQGYKKGVVAMANSGPDTNGSQFFIMVADTPLPNNYTIFGKVVSGQDVADAISNVKTNPSDKPLTNVVMEKVTVSDSFVQ